MLNLIDCVLIVIRPSLVTIETRLTCRLSRTFILNEPRVVATKSVHEHAVSHLVSVAEKKSNNNIRFFCWLVHCSIFFTFIPASIRTTGNFMHVIICFAESKRIMNQNTHDIRNGSQLLYLFWTSWRKQQQSWSPHYLFWYFKLYLYHVGRARGWMRILERYFTVWLCRLEIFPEIFRISNQAWKSDKT